MNVQNTVENDTFGKDLFSLSLQPLIRRLIIKYYSKENSERLASHSHRKLYRPALKKRRDNLLAAWCEFSVTHRRPAALNCPRGDVR